jgi:DNA-binding transcriptional MerR regulator
MGKKYTISQLSHVADIPTTTVRYYERVGLVEPEDRSASNYRLYSGESLRKLKLIRAAKSIGFKLNDVKALLAAPTTLHRPAERCNRLSKNGWPKWLGDCRTCDTSRRC